jgi:hypothetical protein
MLVDVADLEVFEEPAGPALLHGHRRIPSGCARRQFICQTFMVSRQRTLRNAPLHPVPNR